MRRVRVHDVDPLTLDDVAQRECRARISLEGGITRYDVERRLRRTCGERLLRPGGQYRSMTSTVKLLCEPERLALAPAPPSLRIDMQDCQALQVCLRMRISRISKGQSR